jgi:hypothetical protein
MFLIFLYWNRGCPAEDGTRCSCLLGLPLRLAHMHRFIFSFYISYRRAYTCDQMNEYLRVESIQDSYRELGIYGFTLKIYRSNVISNREQFYQDCQSGSKGRSDALGDCVQGILANIFGTAIFSHKSFPSEAHYYLQES